MIVPDDLVVDMRNGRITLTSGQRVVEIVAAGRNGPFANGPISWKRLMLAHIEPALWQFHRCEADL